MGKHYCHLNAQDRIFLGMMLQKDYPKSKIAKILGVDRSTIYREIKRNGSSPLKSKTGRIFYLPSAAQSRYCQRRKRLWKLHSDPKLQCYVHEKLSKGWSPWQIEGRLKLENGGQCQISHETVYRYIYSDHSIRNLFHKKLRNKHAFRVKHNTRKARIPREQLIDKRPKRINDREAFGHWEGNLMLFKRGVKSNLITLRERKTRALVAIKNPNKQSRSTATNIISTMKRLKTHIHSITFDQGCEFMEFTCIGSCLEAAIYFCEPASPEQKGGIENGIGLYSL